MTPWTRWVVWALCLPWNLLVAWPVILAVRLLWGRRLQWQDGVLEVELRPQSWPRRTWYRRWAGTTLGHAVLYGSGRSRASGQVDWHAVRLFGIAAALDQGVSATQFHEHVHVEQVEASTVGGLLLGLVVWAVSGSWVAGVIVWTLAHAFGVLGASLTAWLRGEDPYRGAQHEESAYAQERPDR